MADLIFDILLALVRPLLPNIEFRFPPALARLIALVCGIGATVLCIKALGYLRHIPSTEGSPGGLIILCVAASAALVLACLALGLLWFALVGPSSDD